MSVPLTVLCVTDGKDHAQPFVTELAQVAQDIDASFVLAVDGDAQPWMPGPVFEMRSDGYLESILDDAIGLCRPGFILRVDDDERLTPLMIKWLARRAYAHHDHWAFPRLNLWPDPSRYITNPPLYPDLQTRLSVKAKSGGRRSVHVGSPYGTGQVAPVAIEHHKFIVRSREEREQLLDRYEEIQPGAGNGWAMFSLPELYEGHIVTRPVAGWQEAKAA